MGIAGQKLIKKNYVISIFYIFFEGLSRGGNTLIFIIAATVLSKEEYVNMLAMFSLEALLITLSPINYTDVLYKLRDFYSHKIVGNNIFSLLIIYLIILLLIIIFFNNKLNNFYDSSFTIFVFIIIITVSRLIFQNLSVNHQVDENHKQAIIDKALPFFMSFILGLIGFLLLNNKIFGFFLGRSIGYVSTLFYYKYYNTISISFKIDFNINFIKDHLTRTKFLVLNGISSWILGYGMLNIIKYIYSEDIQYNIGLILTVSSVFMLIANGINNVYVPSFRKLYLSNKTSIKRLWLRIFKGYLGIFLISTLLFLFFRLSLLNSLIKTFNFEIFYNIFHFVLLIFFANIFTYISVPFYIVKDKFKILSFLNTATIIVTLLLIYFHRTFEKNFEISIYFVIILGFFIRSLSVFFYQQVFLRINK